MKFKIVYDRETCIGAAACAAVCPQHWKMVEDGKANLMGSKKNKDGKFEKIVDDLECNQEAADACPVNAIKIEKIKD